MLLLLTQSSFALSDPDAIVKARNAVASSPDNWYILAKSADACIEKGKNMEEAKDWITKSLKLERNSYTLEVMGDYYLETENPKKAMEYYVLSLKEAREKESKTDLKSQQQKIAEAQKMISDS